MSHVYHCKTAVVSGSRVTSSADLPLSPAHTDLIIPPPELNADSIADDGNTPTVGSIGPCTIDIYTGGKTQQTQLQNLAQTVDVSKASSVSVTVDPTIGPDGDFYFIRVTSLGLKDTTNPQYPYQAFSAKFALTGMSGNFSQAVLAQISDSGSNNLAAV
jgi:hypothetical protein